MKVDRDKVIEFRQKAFTKRKQDEAEWQKANVERVRLANLQKKVDDDFQKIDLERERIKVEKDKIEVEWAKINTEWEKAYQEWGKVYRDLGLLNEELDR